MDDEDTEPIDAWGDLNARYKRDSHAQFVLFVEQLAVARELLLSGDLSKQRMALVAIDNLAELVLYRHKRRLTEAAQNSWRDVEPRLDSRDEQRFRAVFNVRVELGLRGAGRGWLESTCRPVLDALDARLFRVGHRYRNAAYHADHHNAAALDLVARAYFTAVARAFVRLQPNSFASSVDRVTVDILNRYGYAGSSQAWPSSERLLVPAEAAQVVTADLCSGLKITVARAKPVLVGDLTHRIRWMREMISSLLADGMSGERFESGISWTYVWREIARDPEIVALERQLRAEWRSSVDEQTDSLDASFEREAALHDQRNARVQTLLTQLRRRPFDLPRQILDLTAGLERLGKAHDLTTLVERYERLDTSMEEIEEMLDDAAIGWDRWVQAETDRLRGK